ncbi:MAG TPA: RnfH family protein [Burkholderiaceae bacterium]|nr:RnfH family protein [Burkholderiaceae bacterium]
MAPDDRVLNVSVAYSPRAGEVDEVTLQLAPGATVADALRASGLQLRYPGLALDALPVGIWGAFCDRGDLLRDRDRVELYRPLRVDPKEARRQRHLAQARVKPSPKVRR